MRLTDSAFGKIVERSAAENEDGDKREEWELLAVAASRAGRWAIDWCLNFEGGDLAESSG